MLGLSVNLQKSNEEKRRRVPEKPHIETISPEHYIYVTASSIFECLHLKWKFLVFLITFAPVFINSNFLWTPRAVQSIFVGQQRSFLLVKAKSAG